MFPLHEKHCAWEALFKKNTSLSIMLPLLFQDTGHRTLRSGWRRQSASLGCASPSCARKALPRGPWELLPPTARPEHVAKLSLRNAPGGWVWDPSLRRRQCPASCGPAGRPGVSRGGRPATPPSCNQACVRSLAWARFPSRALQTPH